MADRPNKGVGIRGAVKRLMDGGARSRFLPSAAPIAFPPPVGTVQAPPRAPRAARSALLVVREHCHQARARLEDLTGALDALERETSALLEQVDAHAEREMPETLTITVSDAARLMGISYNGLRQQLERLPRAQYKRVVNDASKQIVLRTIPWWEVMVMGKSGDDDSTSYLRPVR